MVMAGQYTPSTVQPFPLSVPGVLTVGAVPLLVPVAATYQITNVRASLYEPSVGADVIIDILANGVSVFPTNPANRPTIKAGTNLSSVTVPDSVDLTTNTLCSLNIIQVGSSTPGAGLCVVVMMTYEGP